jgi:hypothetical protein
MADRAPPLIVCGAAGAGKSHYIQTYARTNGLETLICPCRIDRTLREQRTKLHEWAHRLEPSLLWLEGADDLTPEAQSFLRRILETYSPSVHFILECRTIESIQEPIRSRCSMIMVKMPTLDQLIAHASVPESMVRSVWNAWPPSKRTWRSIEHLKFQIDNDLPTENLNIWNQLENEFIHMIGQEQRDYLHCRHLGGNPLAMSALHDLIKSSAERGDGE